MACRPSRLHAVQRRGQAAASAQNDKGRGLVLAPAFAAEPVFQGHEVYVPALFDGVRQFDAVAVVFLDPAHEVLVEGGESVSGHFGVGNGLAEDAAEDVRDFQLAESVAREVDDLVGEVVRTGEGDGGSTADINDGDVVLVDVRRQGLGDGAGFYDAGFAAVEILHEGGGAEHGVTDAAVLDELLHGFFGARRVASARSGGGGVDDVGDARFFGGFDDVGTLFSLYAVGIFAHDDLNGEDAVGAFHGAVQGCGVGHVALEDLGTTGGEGFGFVAVGVSGEGADVPASGSQEGVHGCAALLSGGSDDEDGPVVVVGLGHDVLAPHVYACVRCQGAILRHGG